MGKLTAQEFVSRWRGTKLKERSASQPHFMELCDVLGVPTPTESDRSGESYVFERGTEKIGGKRGFADVWKLGCFAWKYKGPYVNLEKALDQSLVHTKDFHSSDRGPDLPITALSLNDASNCA